MIQSLKPKLIMFLAMFSFMALYMIVFGSKNAVIGLIMVLAAFMSLGNDLSFKPKTSFIKVLSLLLILGIASYLNNPLTIWGCIFTFIVVFGTTFTSHNLFGTDVYIPYLMCYFMMVGIPIDIELLPMRLLSLTFGAVFIVGLNIIVNKKKDYKLTKTTISNLIDELNKAIDLKLAGKEVSSNSFKTANGFYLAIYNKFEYKYFPTKTHQSVLNVVKSFQYIGHIISTKNLTENELMYTKDTLSKIKKINPDDIFQGIELKTKDMALILLNLEIIANEVNNDLDADENIPDRNTVKTLLKPIIKSQITFKSPKFIFAFKMAFIMFIWQLLTLMFNLPFSKWLYFITIPLMMPYINDLAYTAKARIKGTFLGAFIFAVINVLMHYIPISQAAPLMVMVVCIFVMALKSEDKFILTTSTTIMSLMAALIYISPQEAIELKILWVTIGVCVVSLFNFKFMPYSVEIETENNLRECCRLNLKSFDLIKEKCRGRFVNKTTLLVMTNIIRENIEVTDENRELYYLQIKITDICNFILSYLDVNIVSDELKNNLTDIIDKDSDVDENLNDKEKIIALTLNYVKELYDHEKAIMIDLNE